MISQDVRNVKRYCSEPIENIENYQDAVNDSEHMWDCHHRAEILPCGRYTVAQLQKHGLYWHRPASELVFLRHDVHTSLHHEGTQHSDETKRKISESQEGKHHSEETKRKIGEKIRGRSHSDETKRKISEKNKGHIVTSDTRRKMLDSNPMKKKVEMTRLSNGFTMTFPSQKEAARWLRLNGRPKATAARVSQCANGHRATAYGAKWRVIHD